MRCSVAVIAIVGERERTHLVVQLRIIEPLQLDSMCLAAACVSHLIEAYLLQGIGALGRTLCFERAYASLLT